MPHTISKNQFKMDHRSKYKIQNRVSLVALWLKKKKKKKNPPANEGDMGLIPGSGGSHMLKRSRAGRHNS